MTPSTDTARPARSVPSYGKADADEYLRPGYEDVVELDSGWINLREGSRMKRRAQGCQ